MEFRNLKGLERLVSNFGLEINIKKAKAMITANDNITLKTIYSWCSDNVCIE